MAIKVEEIEDQSLPGGACYAFLERKTETFCIYYVSGSSQIFCNTPAIDISSIRRIRNRGDDSETTFARLTVEEIWENIYMEFL